ncbi:hypothetical protein PVE_R2G0412 [Pseudomonas veronii 1YdBTEX2]|uniref:Uncharacterized protein n=1 Tax=Pseudomonas veronii 1YdBTEX2 TaxID=1295141 RepID=A0A1D3K7V8_PSEVE|nr:hypothetical protein PVE_R2G0412 [Pseudomonas veronii 1YdBTEX2]
MSRNWTVVRFPNGSWSYGGSPSDPDYSECEIYSIDAVSPEAAVKSAQSKRSSSVRKAKRQAEKDASRPAAPIS